ncbi:MAG: hypothetical protein ACYTHN_13855, partial [Planctomycetota bacterium]
MGPGRGGDGVQGERLTLNLVPPDRGFRVGEPIFLEARFENRSAEVLQLIPFCPELKDFLRGASAATKVEVSVRGKRERIPATIEYSVGSVTRVNIRRIRGETPVLPPEEQEWKAPPIEREMSWIEPKSAKVISFNLLDLDLNGYDDAHIGPSYFTEGRYEVWVEYEGKVRYDPDLFRRHKLAPPLFVWSGNLCSDKVEVRIRRE